MTETKALAIKLIHGKLAKKAFRIEDFCFPEQIKFIKDTAAFKTAVCSRRSGKTVACAADLIDTALTFTGVVCLYITLNRRSAKRIIWKDLLKINKEFTLGAKINLTDLSLVFPNGSEIHVSGAKDSSEIEKFRGMAIKLCYIDEAQAFRSYLSELIDEVIAPALFDYAGSLVLIGTPGPVPVGYFYDCSQSVEWSKHHWNMFRNPWIEIKSGQSVRSLVDRELKRKGITESHPIVRREYYGEWVTDYDSLVFRYRAEINDYDTLPASSKRWTYVVGVDLGYDDSDAIAVIAFNEVLQEAFLVEEIIKNKQGLTELASQLEYIENKYKPMKYVVDTGGLGKKIVEELNKRFGTRLIAAEKTRKLEFIELLNDAMRTARFKAKKESNFAQDTMLIEWDRDSVHLETKKISPAYHSDIADAVLYAFRECLQWLSQPEPEPIKRGSIEFMRREEERMEENALAELEAEHQENVMEEYWG